MRIKYMPQRPAGVSEPRFRYEFEGETIKATYIELNSESEAVTDTFDFSKLPDGEAQVELIETVLPVNPIKSAKRVNGEIWVKLLWYHGPDAPESERFPQSQEVS